MTTPKVRVWSVRARWLALAAAGLLAACGGSDGSSSSSSTSSDTGTTSSATSGAWSSGACGHGTGAAVLRSGSLSESNASYTASSADESAVCVTGTSTSVTLTDPTITTTGSTSSTDESSFYGLNAAVLDYDGGALAISGGAITTSGAGANGIFSYGTGTVTVSGTTLVMGASTSATGGHGLYAAGGGTVVATDVTATSYGPASSVVATDRGGGTVTVSGGAFTAHGMRSAGIYSTGTITASGGAFAATNAEVVVIEGSNTVTLTGATLTATSGTSEHRGVFLYQSMSGDATNSTCGTGACFTMDGGTYTYGDTTSSSSDPTADCAAFAVSNQTGHVALTDVALSNACPTLLLSALNTNWDYKGGTAVFVAKGVALTGDVVVDASSTADLTLGSSSKGASSLTGAINASGKGKAVALALDAASTWVVTGTSYLTSLSDADATYANVVCQTAGCHVYVNGTAIK